jgi:hypothetical protein
VTTAAHGMKRTDQMRRRSVPSKGRAPDDGGEEERGNAI